jgi:hypothetical protein
MESMELGEFFWWCGFFFCIATCVTFGGLFGAVCFDFLKGLVSK